MDGYKAMYGNARCTAYPTPSPSTGKVEFRYFYVALDRDPGFGPMNFTHIHRSCLSFIDEPPAPINPYPGCPDHLV